MKPLWEIRLIGVKITGSDKWYSSYHLRQDKLFYGDTICRRLSNHLWLSRFSQVAE